MFQTLLLLGLACVIGAVVGGGLKVADIEVPVISSLRRQTMLAIIGLAIVGADLAFVDPDNGPTPPPKRSGLPAGCVTELRQRSTGAHRRDAPTLGRPIKVHLAPAAIAVARLNVWVAHTDGHVTTISLATAGGVQLLPDVIGNPHKRGQVSIAYGMGYAWVTKREANPDRGFLAKLDRSGVRQWIHLDAPDNVAVGGGSVWVTDDNGWLTQWTRNLRPKHKRNIHGDPHGLWAGGRCVYVATTSPDGYSAFDAVTGNQIAQFPVGGAYEITAGAGALWLTDKAGQRLLRVDPADPDHAEPAPVHVTPDIDTLAAGGSGAWTADGRRTVVGIDPRGRDPVPIPLRGEPVGVAVGGDPERVWVAQRASAEITTITP